MKTQITSLRGLTSTRNLLLIFVIGVSVLGVGTFSISSEAKRNVVPPLKDNTHQPQVDKKFGAVPLSFEMNQGQTDKRVHFIARGRGYGLFLTTDEVVIALRQSATATGEEEVNDTRDIVRMRLVNARKPSRIEGLDELAGKANYFIGNDRTKWRTNVPTFAKVKYHQVYKGIDLIYHGNQHQLEYDFVVGPRVSPKKIRLSFGGSRASIDADGNLVITTEHGELRQSPPIAYQWINGQRHEVRARYELRGKSVGFDVGPYDKDLPLVIDPVFIYSTFLGGTGDDTGRGIEVDAQGNAYLTGSTFAADFPLASPIQPTRDSANDAFVTKLNSSGSGLVYSTYLGGNGSDVGNAITVDSQGNAYVVGFTASGSFPGTLGTIQPSKDGVSDGFITKINPTGSALVYSTFIGGNFADTALDVAIDSTGNAYVVGQTDSSQSLVFPALNFSRSGEPLSKSVDSAGTWTPSANGLTASNTTAFAQDPVNPANMYAGTVRGLYRSTDSGANWQAVNSSPAPLTGDAIVIDPSNPSIVYVGSFNGVFKSTNAGITFTLKNTGLIITTIHSLAIDPGTPSTLYAGTSLGIFKSVNGGDSWAEVKNGISGISPRVNEIVIDPANSNTIYIGTANRGLFKTTNAGGLWTPINAGVLNLQSANITGLVIDPVTPNTLYAAATQGAVVNVLFKTTDGGASWSISDNGLTFDSADGPQKPAPNALAINPTTPSTVYAATNIGGVYKTTDGGATWTRANNGLTNIIVTMIAVDRVTPSTVYTGLNIGTDGFLVKLDPTAENLLHSAMIGGDDSDSVVSVALDANGAVYLAGNTLSAFDFPRVNALDSTLDGFSDSFVMKVGLPNTVFYSTFLGGNRSETLAGLVVRDGSAYVVGSTTSSDFPLANPIKPVLGDTLDAFVTKINAAGTALDFSTYLGGLSSDLGLGIAVDGSGVYVTGTTSSSDFPIVDAPQTELGSFTDAFVTKLSSSGSTVVYSTFLGGSSPESANAIAVDGFGNAYVAGNTSSPNFPTLNPFQPALKGPSDAFITKIGVEADLTITKTDSRDPVLVDSQFQYSLQINNLGPSPATNVVVTDSLPAQLSFVSATSTQGSCSFSSPTVTCQLGTLAQGANAAVVITVTGSTPVTVTNTATVTANEPDGNSTNNSSSQSTKISASPSISGHVKDLSNAPVSGVLMTLSGGQSATTTTDPNGFYQFAELAAGANYVITPSKANLSFNPQSRTLNNLTADQTANFIAATCTFSLSPSVGSFQAAGGSSSVDVISLPGCPWTASTSSDFINITSGTSGSGSGTVNFNVSSTTFPRVGRMTIAGIHFPVYQGVNTCALPAFAQTKHQASLSPTVLRIADLNGDNFPDFAVANGGGLSGGIGLEVTVMLNNGSGSFTSTPVDSGLGQLPGGFVLNDFNGDQRPDIAVFNIGSPSIVRILFNNGSGGFGQTSANIPYTPTGQFSLTRRIFTSDVNVDGKPDILVQPATNNLAVLIGNGSGGFTEITPVSFNVVDSPIGLADVNADGKPDLLFGSGNSDRPLSVRLGDGTGAFGSPITSVTPVVNSSFDTADFDGDGDVDIALSVGLSATATNGFAILLGDGAGSFTLKRTFNPGTTGIGGVAVGDFNRDAKPDIAITRSDTKVVIVSGDGLGDLNSPIEFSTEGNDAFPGNFGIGAADFNGDNKPDLATANATEGAFSLLNSCASTPVVVQFAQANFIVSESGGAVQADVIRTGDLSGTSTVNYATVNGTASDRSDYTAALGIIRFAPGESRKSFNVLITDDAFVEGPESLTLALSNPAGATLMGPASTAGVQIQDNDVSPPASNPIDTSALFVRQHYHDFLNREPDQSGFDFWVGEIEGCGANAQCREVKRINVSAAFFLSIEFQNTGYLVYRMYKTGYGDTTSPNVSIPVPVIRLIEFLPDTQRIGQGVIVGQGNWEQILADNKVAYAQEFVQTQRFTTAFPASMTADQFVTKLDENAGSVLSPAEKADLIAILGATPADVNKRAQVVRTVAEDTDLQQREFNRAFVMMQYFGYLRRNPDDLPDTDFRGWEFWLNKLNQFNGNFVQAEMVKAFISSIEYRQRFGP